jgi:uncharacterized protein YndB with AHSA1/START domain
MTRTANDHTFVIERDFNHARNLVFFAFASHEAKKAWFGDTETWIVEEYTFDFREGGREYYRGRPSPNGPVIENDTRYIQIVPDERIIISYPMWLDGKMITVSQQTLEFTDVDGGTHLKLREQIVFLDGSDHLDNRIEGTKGLLEGLAAYLDKTHV